MSWKAVPSQLVVSKLFCPECGSLFPPIDDRNYWISYPDKIMGMEVVKICSKCSKKFLNVYFSGSLLF